MDRPLPYSPPADPATPAVYVWPNSGVAGDDVQVHARGPAGTATIEIARVGARRDIAATETVRLSPHELPPEADALGCGWPVTSTITIGPEWSSGYYEVVIHCGDIEAVGFFVVRATSVDPSRPLLVLSTNTWNAYNDVAGTNIYNGGTHAAFDRPFSPGFLRKPDGPGSRVTVLGPPDPTMRTHVRHIREHGLSAWSGSAGWPSWEAVFVRWAEANGIGLDYAVNADLQFVPGLLDGRRLYLSVGHDEYWSWEMRDAVEGFIAAGGNAAFLSGNVSFWQVRLEDGGRTMVGFKQRFAQDPVYGTDRQERLTSIWSDRLIGRPETSMTGLTFNRGGYHRIGRSVGGGAGGYTVHRPDHWLFEGTGVFRGDLLGAASTVVGYECDGCELRLVDGVPVPTGSDGCPPGTLVLATAPASPFTRATAQRPVPDDALSEVEFHAWRVLGSHDADTARRLENGHAVLAVRDGADGRGTVVSSGCTEWAWGLTGDDPAIERITVNILERLAGSPGSTGPSGSAGPNPRMSA
ncbi:MAG: hypothetical protein JWM34_1730 [Ilumatobacteraceae bacterium]|nr:hypothetical protein [Ilumatobacteraceae bacterium]